jgi:hypothetical protein
MRPLRLLLALAVGLAGCRDSTGLERGLDISPVFGYWSAVSTNRDGSSDFIMLALNTDGSFTRDWRTYTASPARAQTAYVTTQGSFTVRGDSLFMRATTVRSWDRDFNGGVETVTAVADGGPYGSGGARFEVRKDSLVLHYISYPADAPVETSEALARAVFINLDLR